MANPNRCMAYVPKRKPVAQRSFNTWGDAAEFAATFDRTVFDVKETSRKYGSRQRPVREFNVFVYEKITR